MAGGVRALFTRMFGGEAPGPAAPTASAAKHAAPEPGSGALATVGPEKQSLEEIVHPALPEGSSIYGGTKVFPDRQAEAGSSYFTLLHGIAHESSVSFVAILQATRALRKGYDSAIYFYGPGSLNCLATRGFPTTGNSAFPGEHNINSSLATFILEGGTAYCCRFGLSLHGAREEDLMPGVIPTHPLDVQDALIHYKREGAIINSTYML